jgi:NHLM bacteriocin system ABC transporter peptidase/ATP-binding protein
MEAVECGAAALAMILGYYRRFIPLAQLRQDCGVSRDGSKASNVIKAARRHGLKAKGYSKSLDKIKETKCPCIIFWEFNHFIVLEHLGSKTVYVNDPARGHRKLTPEEFGQGFTGVVITLEPDTGFKREGRPASALPGLWRRVQGNLAGIGYMALAGLLLIVPGLAMPALTKVFLDEVITMGRASWFRPLIVAMVASLVLQLVLKASQNYFLRRIQISLAARLTTQFFSHLLRLPISFYTQRYAGEIVNRGVLNDKVARVLTGQLASTIVEMFTMLVYGVVIFSYSVRLSMIGVGSAAFSLLLLRIVSKSRVEANMRLAKEQGMVYGTAIAGLQGMETIKASNMEDGFYTRWSGYFANATNSQQRLATTTQLMTAPATFAQTLTSVLILVVGSFQVISGEMTIGMLVAFQGLMGSFLGPVSSIMGLASVIQELQGDVLRLDDVLQNETVTRRDVPENEGPANPDAEPKVRTEGSLELKGITFGYSPLDKPLIENFDLWVGPGQRVALVGGSGSGKSTIAKIVCGLYDAWEGDILLDGTPVDEVPEDVLRNSLAMVEQDIFLFEGSVRQNLTLWDKTVPDEALESACRDAAILDDVMRLPGGIDGSLNEGGGNLSGGQRQRLELARSLVNNPSVLVLDEATSALDTETETIVDENLRRRGCTCLIVAHRLSTIRDCNEIVVLDRGQVVERGTHEELWAKGGKYANLIGHQDEESA